MSDKRIDLDFSGLPSPPMPDTEVTAQVFGKRPEATDFLLTFLTAMSHEMADNAHKGNWMEKDVPRQAPDGVILRAEPERKEKEAWDYAHDLLYHAAKLVIALRTGDRQAALEYAADVGNCAWFITYFMDALDLDLLHPGPIEYDEEKIQPVSPGTRQLLKQKIIADLTEELFEMPLAQPDEEMHGT